jgi:hypothetical protein
VNDPHLQALIADLDYLLDRVQLSPSRSTATHLAEKIDSRQVLERVYAYLTNLESQHISPLSSFVPAQQSEITPIVQAVIEQINHQLGDWFNSLQTELAELRQQRQSLQMEVQHLQNQHQQMMSELMQTLMVNSQQVLQQQIQQVGETIAQQLTHHSQTSGTNPTPVEHLTELQQNSNYLLQNLDSSLQSVFENLDQDIQGYYDSLSQGLERMHSLGQQSEARLIAFLNRFAQKLEQSSSTVPNSSTNLPKSTTREQDTPENLPAQNHLQTIHQLTDLIPLTTPNPSPTQSIYPQGWYLSLDLGSFSLAAALSQFSIKENEEIIVDQYPLYWSSPQASSFRLPISSYSGEIEDPIIRFHPLKILLSQGEGDDTTIKTILANLLTSLIPSRENSLTIKTTELPTSSLREALAQLAGIIINLPFTDAENYRHRWIDTLLSLNLVQNPAHIYFLPEVIAVLLAHLPPETPSSPSATVTPTLVINSGAIATELGVVKLTSELQNLTHSDFSLSSLAYGGDAFDQDIFGHLIYPQWLAQLNPALPQFSAMMPSAGTANPQQRAELHQYLSNHPLGLSFLEAAKLAKLILQQQEAFTSELMNQTWSLHRQQLKEQIIMPFLQQIEPQIHILLSQQHLSPLEIEQIILSGGTTRAMDYVLSAWLSEQFPHAVILQNSPSENFNRTAMGLGRLPLFPLLAH